MNIYVVYMTEPYMRQVIYVTYMALFNTYMTINSYTFHTLFSGRELAFTFAICYRRSVCRLSVVCLWRWCALLSRLKFSAIFFSPYDSPGTLLFWCQKIVGGGCPFPPEIFVQSDPSPFQIAKFRPISAHSASTVIASEKSSIIDYRKSTTRFPTSHRWTVYVTPKSPKGWHKNAISLFVPVKFNFSRKKSATKFLCVKTFSGKVVATSFPYPTVHRSIAVDVPIYLKLAFKVTHPFRKRRFPKLSFKSAISGLVFNHTIPWPSVDIHRKFYGDRPRGTPPSGDLNARG